ncbi:uncharacterized protein LOC141522769 [Macrotis lagotis]|uniref:uncharacterized protein LOC141522769 n=1 Tax=Macrotis lagotis TaxID=92651 RepID=UPI003D683693
MPDPTGPMLEAPIPPAKPPIIAPPKQRQIWGALCLQVPEDSEYLPLLNEHKVTGSGQEGRDEEAEPLVPEMNDDQCHRRGVHHPARRPPSRGGRGGSCPPGGVWFSLRERPQRLLQSPGLPRKTIHFNAIGAASGRRRQRLLLRLRPRLRRLRARLLRGRRLLARGLVAGGPRHLGLFRLRHPAARRCLRRLRRGGAPSATMAAAGGSGNGTRFEKAPSARLPGSRENGTGRKPIKGTISTEHTRSWEPEWRFAQIRAASAEDFKALHKSLISQLKKWTSRHFSYLEKATKKVVGRESPGEIQIKEVGSHDWVEQWKEEKIKFCSLKII